MKRNKILRIAAVLFALVLISTCGITGAMAKYVDTFTATSNTARAGLFRVTVNGAATNYTVTLGGTLYEGDGVATELNATSSNADKIIVPGSIIKVNSFVIANLSEVDVNIGLAVTGVAGALPTAAKLLFSTDLTNWVSDPTTLASNDLLGTPTGFTNIDGVVPTGLVKLTGTATVAPSLYILWPFADDAKDQNGGASSDGQSGGNADLADTTLGKAAATEILDSGAASGTVSVSFAITATQID